MEKNKRQKLIDETVKEMLECEDEIPDVEGTDEHFFEDIPDITDEEADIIREASHIALKKFSDS